MNFCMLAGWSGQSIRNAAIASIVPVILLFAAFPLPVQAQFKPSNQADNGSATRVVNTIAAVVNSEIITSQELEQRIAQIAERLQGRGAATPARVDLRRQVLDQMINEKVQLQQAKELGIRVDDIALDRALLRIAEQNQLSLQQLRDQVEQEGLPFSRFRDDIRQQITLQRLRERQVANKIRISEAEIDNYLAANAGAAKQSGEELHLAQILIRVPEKAPSEQVLRLQQRAEQALQQLKAGTDFRQIAAAYSDAARNEADLGWRSAERLPQLFVAAIAQLQPGELSPVIRSGAGFHILKVLGRRKAEEADGPTIQQTRVRHILLKVNQMVSAEEARRRLTELKQRLENNAARFEDLAKMHSNDLSASQGGDLGWIYPGDTVPEFEQAMDALQPGEISDPVESPFGYHLIQVLERRIVNVPKERMRLAARQAIYERKLQTATDEWLRELRDKAYVEYRLDAGN